MEHFVLKNTKTNKWLDKTCKEEDLKPFLNDGFVIIERNQVVSSGIRAKLEKAHEVILQEEAYKERGNVLGVDVGKVISHMISDLDFQASEVLSK